MEDALGWWYHEGQAVVTEVPELPFVTSVWSDDEFIGGDANLQQAVFLKHEANLTEACHEFSLIDAIVAIGDAAVAQLSEH